MQDLDQVARDFNVAYYDAARRGGTWHDTRYLGIPVLKYPTDLWIYQEILCEVRPDVIVETGTFMGGSALYLAFLCQNTGRGEVVTIDVENHGGRPPHPLVTYVMGSSVDPLVLAKVKALVAGRSALVILDSDHRRDHVLAEMRAYAPLVPVGGYMVVEDTNVNGNPVNLEHGPGPMEAVEEFFRTCDEFSVDEAREKFMLTTNPSGFLRRVKEASS